MDRIATPPCVMTMVRLSAGLTAVVERQEREDERHDYEPEPGPVMVPRPRPAVGAVPASSRGGR
ncbi:hypothetical protein [Streptomyces marianii]|uniref:Uncharacterized protein n=1 Tax=Streptomyces marianii TaxID=1817406 RepID=A0A5R9DSR3_9ACTN|nr:hypothetical protein [Streptomyces marianii]TLQ38622.1 hypothetical protein FEF34_40815 [Streptomyces marianii]